ncbi:MAG: DUF262 domain-containing protein [Nautiliaceae bacterium]
MSKWESKRLSDVVELIDKKKYVLPVIQRSLVWNEEKIEMLFDSLLRGFSFGAIMLLKDLRNKEPLFEYRPFFRDYKVGDFIFSKSSEKLMDDLFYVIDGQQRLSAFYIGLKGSFNNKELYFDLYSNNDYVFKFFKDKIKNEVETEDGKREAKFVKVKDLYELIIESDDKYEIMETLELEGKEVEKNIDRFISKINSQQVIGVDIVTINKRKDKLENRLMAVELFRRLNQGGTKLDALELMASTLKGFTASMEEFLYNDVKEFEDIGFSKDEVIKLIFLLQDNHKKKITEIDKKDAEFIETKRDRIISSLKGTKQFLKASRLYSFYTSNKPSIIPLYFITYYLFHLNKTNTEIENFFGKAENSKAFKDIYNWIYISMLNKVFRRRGAGWTAYSTGVRKILEVLKNYKNKDFPVNELFKMYEEHPLDFDREIKKERLDDYDFNFLMYILYDKNISFRKDDIDHIHPKSLLENFTREIVDTVGNFQLLEADINRNEKRAKELKDWINSLENKEFYIKRHLIPNDEKLWESKNYEEFLKEREKLIIDKLKREII